MVEHCCSRAGIADECAVSLIVPVLNEARIIQDTLLAVRGVRGCYEVIIVDGGSDDGSLGLVSAAIEGDPRFKVISSLRGRGNQLNAGAAIARGRVLLFLHADTQLPDTAIQSIQHALEQPGIVGGNFRLEFEGPGLASHIFTWLNSLRRWFGIYYGDSAIWVRRDVFIRLGPLASARLMEDYDLCRRLERTGPTACLSPPVITSARRWRHDGVIGTLIVWTVIQWLYLIGVSSDRLARLYYPE
jgi:rSAM/selenodomain-associated transferase 2